MSTRLACLVVGIAAAALATGALAETSVPSTGSATIPSAGVQQNWFERGEEGWYWYQDPELEKSDEPNGLVETPTPAPDAREPLYPPLDQKIDPLVELKRVKEAVETAQARVVLQPTEAHVREWLAVMHEMNARSALFADRLRRTVWSTPEYDYSLVRPSNPTALGAWTAAYNDERRTTLQDISRRFGLYFFLRGDCPYCHQLAPFLKRFAETYGFDVLAVTLDGGTVPEYPNATYSPTFAERLGVQTVPALFLANPRENDLRPVAYGMISLGELESRIYRLFRMDAGQVAFRIDTNVAVSP